MPLAGRRPVDRDVRPAVAVEIGGERHVAGERPTGNRAAVAVEYPVNE